MKSAQKASTELPIVSFRKSKEWLTAGEESRQLQRSMAENREERGNWPSL